jgi:hypothetical protein
MYVNEYTLKYLQTFYTNIAESIIIPEKLWGPKLIISLCISSMILWQKSWSGAWAHDIKFTVY